MAHRAFGRVNWQTLSPLFWLLAAVYAGHRLWTWLELPRAAWIRFYLDDLLCLPLILNVSLLVMRLLHGPHFRLTPHQVGIAVVYYAMAFEVVLPLFMPRYTADLTDAFLYAIGGWFFHKYLNK
ncbi:hypothetical protein GU926_16095 [Nibribacter ruber]|uniref:Magnesium citrate secondary transporter n=1 Tax=Nibribacter ruber TaxID=2698458 RepID=A0A6P1P3F6_9BACT|nr:hypothetical protein [Nibribacter ruber]QHL88866.1 hypothetical protein GU926_16095 [Nibribacter ruber]